MTSSNAIFTQHGEETPSLGATRRIPIWLPPLFTFAAIVAVTAIRLVLLKGHSVRFGYGIALITFLWLRNRRWLWITFFSFACLSCYELVERRGAGVSLGHALVDVTVSMVNLLVFAGAVHFVISGRGELEGRNQDLHRANNELASREEEIARQNAKLQTQAMDLEGQRSRLEAVLRAAPIGIAVANADCTDVRLNPTGAALFDTPPDTNVAPAATGGSTLISTGATGPWRLFEGSQPLTPGEYPLVRATRGEEVRGLEIEVLLPSGRRMTQLTNASPVRDPQGNPSGAVAAFADITPQKELQRELDVRRREAEEASGRKTRFLAAVSHDIRTPANAISLLAELIRRTSSNPELAGEVPELARELQASALSLVNLLSDVLDLARFDSGKVELLETEFALDVLLREETRQMQPLARQKSLELAAAIIQPSILLRTDRIKLSRILGNLIGNAIKFTDQGSVRINAARSADGGVDINVCDTGIGIAPEFRQHIFDEFFQLRNPERDRNKGIGLGLTICKRLVDAMGARLQVQSAPNAGTTFTVALPPTAVIN